MRLLAGDQARRVDGALEAARVGLADRHAVRFEHLADDPRLRASLVIELPLLRDVFEVQRIGVGLIGMGAAVANHDHVAAAPQRAHHLVH